MNGYSQDITTNMENSRNCLRRIARHDDQEFSNQSIINVIEKFVKSVNSMDDAILIPSRLMDSQVGDATDVVSPTQTPTKHKKKAKSVVRDQLTTCDLFNLYNMLNSVKTDLLWGRNQEEAPELGDEDLREQNYDTVEAVVPTENTATPLVVVPAAVSVPTTSEVKGHIRRPSTVSVSSSNSSASTISDSESEVSSNENDSGIESEQQHNKDRSEELSQQFHAHLLGLYKSLEQMTEAANYLSHRYQCDIGATGV